jgi:hypothetical protein
MNLAEARRRDRILYDLAFYEITQGMMMTEMSTEGVIDLHRQVALRFNHFKKLVQSGEYTIKELEHDITSKHAAIAKPTVGHSIDDLDKFVEDFDKQEDKNDPIGLDELDGGSAFQNILRAFIFGNQGQVDLSYLPPEDYIPDSDEFDDEEDEFE